MIQFLHRLEESIKHWLGKKWWNGITVYRCADISDEAECMSDAEATPLGLKPVDQLINPDDTANRPTSTSRGISTGR